MTDQLRKAAQAVLDLLDWMPDGVDCDEHDATVEALREALQSADEPVAWGAFYFGGNRDGKLYAQCDTQANVENYIGHVHQSNDSITLRAGPLYTTPPSIDALIAEAIEKHDDEMADIRTVNTRKIAQPCLDALIAEIDGLLANPDSYTYETLIHKFFIECILDKYRSKE